jgi:hypothetical protein
MANTALIGDNHGMFHQVGPIGPFDEGTRRITPSAVLGPVADSTGDWGVTDHGDLIWGLMPILKTGLKPVLFIF